MELKTSIRVPLMLILSLILTKLGIGHSQPSGVDRALAGVDREDPQFEVGNTTVLDDARQEVYEIPIYILGVKSNKLLLRREAPAIPPNYFVRNLDSGEEQQVSPCPKSQPARATSDSTAALQTRCYHARSGLSPDQGNATNPPTEDGAARAVEGTPKNPHVCGCRAQSSARQRILEARKVACNSGCDNVVAKVHAT